MCGNKAKINTTNFTQILKDLSTLRQYHSCSHMEEIKMDIKLNSGWRRPRPKPRCEENARKALSRGTMWGWTVINLLRTESHGGLLWPRQCTLGSHKGEGISWPAEGLSAFQGLLCSTELMIWVEVPTQAAEFVYKSLWLPTLTECSFRFPRVTPLHVQINKNGLNMQNYLSPSKNQF